MYLNNCFCICYLNHRTGIVRRVTWVREVFARVHIDVDQALEKGKLTLTIRKRENFGVHCAPITYQCDKDICVFQAI